MQKTSKIFFSLFFCMLLQKASAQFIIDSFNWSKPKDLNITGQTQYISDQQNRPVNQILNLTSSEWCIVNKKEFVRHTKNTIYWFKFDVLQSSDLQQHIYLKLSNKGINRLILYSVENNKIMLSDTTGDMYPYSNRPYPSEYFVFPLSLKKGIKQSFLLYCDKKNENLNLELHLQNNAQLKKQEVNLYLFIGMFVGFLFLGFITSIALYIILRNRLHLWYGIYILSTILFLLTYESLDFKWFYPNHPFYANISRYNSSSISLALICYVMQLFCDQDKNNSIFFRITNIIRHAILSNLLLSFVVYYFFPATDLKKIYFFYFLLTQISGILVTLTSCVEKVIQGYKPAYFYLSAVSFLLITGMMAIISEVNGIDISKDTPNLLQIGFIVEVVLISIGILYKYYLVRKEVETIRNELHDMKLTTMKQTLQVQYKERKRIAEDIHDVLGSHLAAIKIKIDRLKFDSEDKIGLINSINELSSTTREIAHNLIPKDLSHHDLLQTIQQYLANINQNQKIKFSFTSIGTPRPISKNIEYTIYKIMLELINNILKHSQANDAFIQFFFKDEGDIEIIIEDNGIGIDYNHKKGIGLSSIFQRIKNLEGDFVIDSRKGNTTIIINIPITK